MPGIEIDDEVWDWLKSQARPFEDTPNTVLRRVAGLDGVRDSAASVTPTEAPQLPIRRGRRIPQGDYREPILRILAKHKGQASRNHVLRELETAMAARLTEFDRSDIASGTIRWQKAAEWEISTMRQRGFLKPQSECPRGVWCLSVKGQKAAQSLSSGR